jgi:hypothetical protein
MPRALPTCAAWSSTRPLPPTGAVRAAAASGAELPEPAGSYAANVRNASYRITGADLAGLHAAGLSDDAVFEITIAAAVGAALRGLDAGMRAVREQA